MVEPRIADTRVCGKRLAHGGVREIRPPEIFELYDRQMPGPSKALSQREMGKSDRAAILAWRDVPDVPDLPSRSDPGSI